MTITETETTYDDAVRIIAEHVEILRSLDPSVLDRYELIEAWETIDALTGKDGALTDAAAKLSDAVMVAVTDDPGRTDDGRTLIRGWKPAARKGYDWRGLWNKADELYGCELVDPEDGSRIRAFHPDVKELLKPVTGKTVWASHDIDINDYSKPSGEGRYVLEVLKAV